MNTKKRTISKCCEGAVVVRVSTTPFLENTNLPNAYYECVKCGKPCDVKEDE